MIKRLFNYGKKGRRGAIQQIIVNWIMMIFPVLTASVIFSNYQTDKTKFWKMGILILILLFISLYFSLPYPKKLMNQWAVSAKQQIRNEYLNGIFNTSTTDSKKLTAETVINRDLQGIDRLDIFYNSVFPSFCSSILSYLLIILLSFFWHSWIWILPIISIFLIGIGMMLLQKVGPKINWEYMNGWLSMGSRFVDDLQGMNTLVMYGASQRYKKTFSEKSEFFRKKTMDLLKYQLQSLLILNSLIFGTLAVCTAMLWFNIQSNQIELTQSLILWILIAELLVSERQLGYLVHVIISTKPALTNIFNIIDNASKKEEISSTFKNFTHIKEIKLENASFAYHEHPNLFQKADLDLKCNHLYGLVGVNGSGKSTLAQILRNELVLLDGKLVITDSNNQEISTKILKDSVGYLSPQPFLFSGSIEENLTLGGAKIQSDWKGYLKKLGLCEFIYDLPENFQTKVGENGRFLSPGQCQQIAFARLILTNKDVYIFDEVTANIDVENSQIIFDAIKKLSKSKIILIITHEWSIINQLENIYFLSQKHFNFGTVNELDQNNKKFQELMKTQKILEEEL